jgi:hypothetical protein
MTLKEAYISPQQSGDIASGRIRLVYEMGSEERVYEIPYDTRPGRGGDLAIRVDVEVGDTVRCMVDDQMLQETVTEEILECAEKTLSHYRTEATQGKGAVSDGRVVFSGIVGVNDDWLPTDD